MKDLKNFQDKIQKIINEYFSTNSSNSTNSYGAWEDDPINQAVEFHKKFNLEHNFTKSKKFSGISPKSQENVPKIK